MLVGAAVPSGTNSPAAAERKGLAKNVGMSPRDCAMKIVDGIRPLIEDIMEEPEIAGPGFINLRFKKEYLEKSVQNMAKDAERLAVPVTR